MKDYAESEARADVLAVMAAAAAGDGEGLTLLYEHLDVLPRGRVGSLIAGLSGYALGWMCNALEAQGVPEDQAREYALQIVTDTARESGPR